MASRTFTIRTEPHEAHVGPKTLLFVPEADGAEFVAAYDQLTEMQKRLVGRKATSNKAAKPADTSPEALKEVNAAMRSFIDRFLLDDSKPDFAEMKIPDRVLVQIIEFLAEVYGGGSGNPDEAGGTSTG